VIFEADVIADSGEGWGKGPAEVKSGEPRHAATTDGQGWYVISGLAADRSKIQVSKEV